MWTLVIVPVALAYVAYRLSLSVRAARAQRRGDRETADGYRTTGGTLFVGVTMTFTLVLVVLMVVVLVRS